MLEKIHRHTKGWLAVLIIFILVLSFALFGVQNYLFHTTQHTRVAKVNGESITVHALDSTYRLMLASWQSIKHRKASKRDQNALKLRALQLLLKDRLITQAGKRAGFVVTQQQAALFFHRRPYLQEKGRFSWSRYHRFLSEIVHETEEHFLQNMQGALLNTQLYGAFADMDFLLPHEKLSIARYIHQKRTVDYHLLTLRGMHNPVPPTASEIQAAYRASGRHFRQPARVRLQYIVLSPKMIQKSMPHRGKTQTERLAWQRAFEKRWDAARQTLTELSYMYPDHLKKAASSLGLRIQSTDYFTKKEKGKGIAQYPVIKEAAFEDEVLKLRHNSDVLTLPDQRLVVLRRLAYQPEHLPAMKKVRGLLVQQLNDEKRKAALLKLADKVLKITAPQKRKAWIAQQGWLLKQKTLRAQDQWFTPAVMQTIFRLTVKHPWAGLWIDQQRYVLLHLNHVTLPTQKIATSLHLSKKERAQWRIPSLYGEAAGLLYEKKLIQKAHITVDEALLGTFSESVKTSV